MRFFSNRQDDTTNSQVPNTRIETGWGVITGVSGTTSYNEAITFQTAFTNRPIVIAVAGGDGTTANGSTYGKGTNAISADWQCKAVDITTAGFNIYLRTSSFSANGFVFYQWIAIGT